MVSNLKRCLLVCLGLLPWAVTVVGEPAPPQVGNPFDEGGGTPTGGNPPGAGQTPPDPNSTKAQIALLRQVLSQCPKEELGGVDPAKISDEDLLVQTKKGISCLNQPKPKDPVPDPPVAPEPKPPGTCQDPYALPGLCGAREPAPDPKPLPGCKDPNALAGLCDPKDPRPDPPPPPPPPPPGEQCPAGSNMVCPSNMPECILTGSTHMCRAPLEPGQICTPGCSFDSGKNQCMCCMEGGTYDPSTGYCK